MSKQQNTPQYIKQIPWYARNQQGEGAAINTPTFESKYQLQQWYQRGKKGFQATNFRKGACQNCGAMGHKKKECTQRPRKTSVKFTNKNIAADDVMQDINLDWEGKRDRWNGYDPEMYKQVIEEYNEFQEMRKKRKLEQGADDPDDQYRQTKDAISLANLPTKIAKSQKFTGLAGNRNRQQMAVYLKSDAPYDPKSRAHKGTDDPFSQAALQNQGQKYDLAQQDKFAFDQVQKNNAQLSSVALPTLTQKIFRTVKQKNQMFTSGRMGELSKKYGDNGVRSNINLDVVVQQEAYFQNPYDYESRKTIRSSYEQDVYVNDHIAVWGSWYNQFLGWGYACCHATEKMSYCLGNKGKQKALAKQLKIKAQKLKQDGSLQQKQPQIKDLQKVEENIQNKIKQ